MRRELTALLLLLFTLAGFSQSVRSYEYWIDSDYDGRNTAVGSGADITLNIDVGSLAPGLHYFNFRPQDSDNSWGPLFCRLVYVPEDDTSESYEYWIDNDYANRKSELGGGGNLMLTLEDEQLKPGFHFFNFRVKNGSGIYGPLFRTMAYMPEDTTAAAYEYWIDDDVENKQTIAATGGQPVLTIDGSKLRTGVHYFNFRVKENSGMWGPLKRELFNIEFKDMPINGYQYAVDSTKVNVTIEECTEYALNKLEIDLSDHPNLGSLDKGCTWEFNEEKSEATVYRRNNLTFLIKFKNKANEWSIPEGETLEFPDTVTKPMQNLQPGPQIKIAKVGGGDFIPLLISVTESRDYYLQTTQPCKMHLFDSSGDLLKTIDGDSLLQGEKTALTAGNYYGVIYNTVKNEAHPADSLHVMLALQKHVALTPTIKHKKDIVTITCEQQGVDIYYTIDNTPPTTESTRYAKPFNLLKNSTVRAIAAGNGYAPSAEATADIDPFKVEPVTYTADGYMLTMQTETEETAIYYTVDGTTPSTSSSKYEAPVALTASCTVKAYATRTGYTDSEVPSFVFDADSVTSKKPQLSSEGNVITITTETEDATIYYTTDGSAPTAESAKYTAPFNVTENGTVKAVAKRKNYFDSPVGSMTVDWFKVADVQFTADGYMLTMTTDTTKAVIYYTTNGTTPTAQSTRYDEPIALTSACTVKAIAMRSNFKSSEVTQYQFVPSTVTAAAPKLEHYGNTAVMTTETASANVYYTLDGTEPTAESTLYEKPFELVENGTVKAIAVRQNYFDSPVSSMTVDWFKVDTVAFSTDGYLVSMVTNTPDATIYFTTDGSTPTTSSVKYVNPVGLTTQCTVTAFAVKKNFHNSDITYFNFNPGDAMVSRPQIINEGNVISITTATEGAAIYYTLDGTEPSEASERYVNPFTVTGNCAVKAIAVKDKYINSPVNTFEVNWFKVSDVQFYADGYLLTMWTDTEGTTIYYTTDGGTPTKESVKYTQPITLTSACTVKAIGVKDNYNNSDVTAFDYVPGAVTVATPSVERIGSSNVVSISTTTVGASIYYTTDGTTPTAEKGTLYIKAFEVTHNCVVKAIAMKENYINSQVSELTVDWFRVEKPVFTLNGTTLSISCSSQGANIYYSIGEDSEPSKQSTLYTGPIVLTDNRPVKAVAVMEGYKDSEVAVFNEQPITSAGVTMSYNGHYLTITAEESEAVIYYTTDGSAPTADAFVYTAPVAISELCTVRAAAMRPYTNMSAVSNYEVMYAYDGKHAVVREAGLLVKAFDWCGAGNVQELRLAGPLNNTDLATLRSLPNLKTLDMEQVQLDGQMLPEEALKGAAMRWFVSPAAISSVGRNVLADCPRLAAITWNSTTVPLKADLLGEHLNPNMLYYVSSEAMISLDNVNVVSNGHARDIILYNGEEYHDFYCPERFTADNITYTRDFQMKTVKGTCQGWETIALPFKVQSITHWKNGAMVPFAARQASDGMKPFWLARLDAAGFVSAGSMEANTPYIISMPNDSAAYADRNLQAGSVTFSAKNAEVAASEVENSQGVMNDVVFVANYASQEPSADIYAVNLEETERNPIGSIFLPNYRKVRPFEAYTSSTAAQAPKYIAISAMNGSTTGIIDIQSDYGWIDRNFIKVYNLNGLLVKAGPEDEVMKHLPKGVYIISGRKVVVK